MSTKHFFSSTEGVVLQGLESLVARNKHLALDVSNKVVYSKTHSPSKVAVISGGGGGHEPAWSGYVGDGMLAAAVNGEVFASPSTKQIMAAFKHVPSDAGIILCVTNYTGDNLHFGLAKEKAAGMGYKIDVLKMTDDVALGRKQTSNLGRRGLAANMFVLKLCGSAAEEGRSFEECMKIGAAVNANAVTMGSSLDHCHIPGRGHHRSIQEITCVLGMGIHNEPGLYEISPVPVVDQMVRDMLRYCLDPNDEDRAYVKFQPEDVVLLLINNFGGISTLELEALTHVTKKTLKQDWDIDPQRIFAQCFESSLNAPGWSISLLNVSGIEQQTGLSTDTTLGLLDHETKAPAWPKSSYRDVPEAQPDAKSNAKGSENEGADFGPTVDPAHVETTLRSACEAAIQAERDLTKWDIQMGDGDCGEAVVNMCQGVLKKLDSGLCDRGALFHILDEVGDAVEEVGGTLAAIVSILLASYTTSLRKAFAESKENFQLDIATAGQAASMAISNLMNYTSARKGGRTVMDALIPFCETLHQDRNLSIAVEAAEAGAETTSGMKAKFGRATYIGEKAEIQEATPPDPGAKAAAIFLRGLLRGSEK